MTDIVDSKIKQIILDKDKLKQQLLDPFRAIPDILVNEQATLQELMQRCRALSTATKDYLISEDPNNPEFRLKAEQLQDIASDPHDKQKIKTKLQDKEENPGQEA